MSVFSLNEPRLIMLALAMSTSVACIVNAADRSKATVATSADQVDRLIEQLGSEQFATREKAQSKLERLGVEVFDELLEAQHHADIEIARRATYLLRGVPIAWSVDSDPQQVRSLLRNYSEQGRIERQSRIAHLASLEDSIGAAALCRIARFETDSILSKQAALRLMWHDASDEVKARREVAKKIKQAISNSQRTVARWLQTYAESLETPEQTLEAWQQITQDELETLVRKPQETQRSVVRDLLRWHIDLLRDLQRSDDVRANVIRVVELVEPERKELFDVVDWAMEREAWYVPELLAERFPAAYWQDEMLVYRLAESKRKQGDEAAAAEYAQRALEMNPNQWNIHMDVARQLRFDRYMFDWSEAEFRRLIETSADSTRVELLARGFLAEMLSDLEREKDAAEVLEVSFEIGERDPAALAAISEALYRKSYKPADLRAKIDHLLGIHLGREGKVNQQKVHLWDALKVDEDNIDIVIALHRVDDSSAEWKQRIAGVLAHHVGKIEARMEELETAIASNAERDFRDTLLEELAQKNNEYAWLVSNTVGDYAKAVACSQKSLELIPDSWPYQDTLGRCYFAIGDYDNAIRYQKLAVDQAPYMQQMQRQLKLFEEAQRKAAQNEQAQSNAGVESS